MIIITTKYFVKVSLYRIHRSIITIAIRMIGACPMHAGAIGHAPDELIHQVFRRQKLVKVMRLLRLPRDWRVVLWLEREVVIAAGTDVAGNRGRVRAPRCLAVAQVVEGLRVGTEEAVEHAVAIMHVHAVLL